LWRGKLYHYALSVSALSIIFIKIFNPKYFWPWSITVFIFQIIAVLIAEWLLKLIRNKYTKSKYIAPGILLYRRFFAISLSFYLILGLFNQAESMLARFYVFFLVIGFMGISIAILYRIMIAGDLLDRFNDDNKE